MSDNARPAPILSKALLEGVFAHAEEAFPEECCGFLMGPRPGLGQAATPTEQRRVKNRQNELHEADPETFQRDAKTAYNMGGADLLFLDKSLSSEQPVLVLYHSHCNVGAYFSAEDERAAMYDGEPLYPTDYLVVDVQDNKAVGAKVFRFDQSTGRFAEVAQIVR